MLLLTRKRIPSPQEDDDGDDNVDIIDIRYWQHQVIWNLAEANSLATRGAARAPLVDDETGKILVTYSAKLSCGRRKQGLVQENLKPAEIGARYN